MAFMEKLKSNTMWITKIKPKNLTFYLKFIAIILLLSYFKISSASNYAQNAKLSLSVKDVSIKQALKQIEQQSDFYFMYNDSKIDVNKKITLKAEGHTIYELLDKILLNSGIIYEVIEKQIVLNPKGAKQNDTSQQNIIKGTVVDQKGSPLPGVNVFVKGTTVGTTTDLNGKYSLSIPGGDVILVYSFVGFTTQEIMVDNQQKIDVTLLEETTKLDEIVVIGYGSSSKKLLTSSVASINSEDIDNNISSGIESALQGRTSGVMVNQNSGTPGAAISVNIRGLSSISAGTQPLYVVDGIPVTSGDYSQISMEGQSINAVADINPNNIKSISVLKDASAAAIYGARAGNGVILIETKSGAEGKTQFDFQTYYGIQEVYKKLELLNAADWKDYIQELGVDVSGFDPNIDTDWLDEVLRLAPVQNYELSASGGKEKTKFFFSGRYFNQEGVVLGTNYEKYNGRLNLDHKISDKFNIGAKLSVNYSINDRVRGDQSINGVLPNAVSTPPVYQPKDENGNYAPTGWWDNPVAIGEVVDNTAKSFRNLSNVFGEYEIIKDLKFKHQFGFDYYNLQEHRYEPSVVKSASATNGYSADGSSDVIKTTHQSTLNYIKAFNEVHNFNFLLGYSFEKWKEKFLIIGGTEFPTDQFRYLDAAAVIDEDYSETSYAEFGLESYFGRVKYNFKNKYLFSVSLRRDGSSNFGENYQYANLPAGSFAWRVAEENFMSDLDIVSELKLKLSYGYTGNDNIGAFRSRKLYSAGYNYYGSSGIIPTQIANPDLKWETTSNLNAGFDLGLFGDRILLYSDFYYNRTEDLLLSRVVPGSTGFTSVSDNVGELENKGLEFQLVTDNFKGEFNWTSSFNISFNRNKVLKLYNDQPLTPDNRGSNAVLVDEPIGVFYMYKSLGVDPSSGELVLEDINHDGVINDSDKQVVGSPHPDFSGGLSNDLSYKNFSLNIFIQYSYGNEIFNGVRQYAENMTISNDNQLVTVKDRWKEPGDETYIPKVNGQYNNFVSSHYIEDGSYLRLKSLTLSYNLPNQLLDKIKLKSARVFLRGQNLYTLTPYSGMDPEVNYAGTSTVTRGVDFFTYPQVRTYSLGIKMKF